MENEYVLYLDESKTVDNIFVIGGFAVSLNKVDELEKKFTLLKNRTWPGHLNQGKEMPVFHAVEYMNKKPDAFIEMIEIVKDILGTTFACIIKLDELYELYGIKEKTLNNDEGKVIESEFNIALQKVIENYTHYLYYRNAFGKIMYEKRNTDEQTWFHSPDFYLKADYQTIIANNKGISYLNDEIIKYCNVGFSVKSKKSNVAGLQIADTISYVLAKSMSPSVKVNKDVEYIFDKIYELAYNGRFNKKIVDYRKFYGIRIIPEMFRNTKLERQLKNANKFELI